MTTEKRDMRCPRIFSRRRPICPSSLGMGSAQVPIRLWFWWCFFIINIIHWASRGGGHHTWCKRSEKNVGFPINMEKKTRNPTHWGFPSCQWNQKCFLNLQLHSWLVCLTSGGIGEPTAEQWRCINAWPQSLHSLIFLTKSWTQSITKDLVHSPLVGSGNWSSMQNLGGVEGIRKGRGREEWETNRPRVLCLQQLPSLLADAPVPSQVLWPWWPWITPTPAPSHPCCSSQAADGLIWHESNSAEVEGHRLSSGPDWVVVPRLRGQ